MSLFERMACGSPYWDHGIPRLKVRRERINYGRAADERATGVTVEVQLGPNCVSSVDPARGCKRTSRRRNATAIPLTIHLLLSRFSETKACMDRAIMSMLSHLISSWLLFKPVNPKCRIRGGRRWRYAGCRPSAVSSGMALDGFFSHVSFSFPSRHKSRPPNPRRLEARMSEPCPCGS